MDTDYLGLLYEPNRSIQVHEHTPDRSQRIAPCNQYKYALNYDVGTLMTTDQPAPWASHL